MVRQYWARVGAVIRHEYNFIGINTGQKLELQKRLVGSTNNQEWACSGLNWAIWRQMQRMSPTLIQLWGRAFRVSSDEGEESNLIRHHASLVGLSRSGVRVIGQDTSCYDCGLQGQDIDTNRNKMAEGDGWQNLFIMLMTRGNSLWLTQGRDMLMYLNEAQDHRRHCQIRYQHHHRFCLLLYESLSV